MRYFTSSFDSLPTEDKVALYGYYSSLLNLVGRLLIDGEVYFIS